MEIHPETAVLNGVADGDLVIIETKYGQVEQTARLTDNLMQGVVCAAHGWWFPEGDPASQYDWRSANFNMLTSVGKLGKEYGTPNLKSLPCRIRRKA
jgi:anaerobic selenocysteine-containing dehydrogenase